MFLEIEQLRKSYGTGENKVEVLKGIQLGVEKGKICVLLGPSGSGKSTLLNIVGGIDTADSGSVTVAGEVMQGMNDRQLTEYRRKHLGYVFQAYNLIGNLTVRENIEVGAYLSSRTLDIDELLDVLGLTEHQNKIPSQLSGRSAAADGNRQGNREKSGYSALRRADRRPRLSYLKGYSGTDRAGQSEIRQYNCHSHPQ